MPEPPSPGSPDLDELVTLARRFADRKRYDEAIDLFQLALRLEPQDLGLRLAVARLRKLSPYWAGDKPLAEPEKAFAPSYA